MSTDLIDDQIPVLHLTQPDNIVQLNLKVRKIHCKLHIIYLYNKTVNKLKCCYKLQANYLLEREDYSAAIVLYNEAIGIHNNCELFMNRAEAYIQRKWLGDFYAALKDCITAIKLEPNLVKAHILLAECLYRMNKDEESKLVLDQLIIKYPLYEPSSLYKSLYSSLNAKPNDRKALHGNFKNVFYSFV